MNRILLLLIAAFVSGCSPWVWDDDLYSYPPGEFIEPISFLFYNLGDSSQKVINKRMAYYKHNERYLVTINDLGMVGIDSAAFIFREQQFKPVHFSRKDYENGSIDLHYVKTVHPGLKLKLTKVSFDHRDNIIEEHVIVTRLMGDTVIFFNKRKTFCLKLQTSLQIRYRDKSMQRADELYDGPSVTTYTARAVGPVMYTRKYKGVNERWMLRSISSPRNSFTQVD